MRIFWIIQVGPEPDDQRSDRTGQRKATEQRGRQCGPEAEWEVMGQHVGGAGSLQELGEAPLEPAAEVWPC